MSFFLGRQFYRSTLYLKISCIEREIKKKASHVETEKRKNN